VIRTYRTLATARRAAPHGPILRILADPDELFIVGLSGASMVYAVDPNTGVADGSIKVLDLMAGGR
jgi:hypothetical protein